MRNPARYQKAKFEFHLPRDEPRQQVFIMVDGNTKLDVDTTIRDKSHAKVGGVDDAFRRCYFEWRNCRSQLLRDIELEAEIVEVLNDDIPDGKAYEADDEDLKEIHRTWSDVEIPSEYQFFIEIRGSEIRQGIEEFDEGPF